MALAALALLGLGGCVRSSATQTLLRESSPVIRRCDQIRSELERDGEAGDLATRAGCPVCQW